MTAALLPAPSVRSPLPIPLAAGNLDAYIASVNRLPLLSEEEERTYARRLREHDDVDAARQLVVSHLRVVVAVARGYLGYGLPHADLIQEGNVGLMKAVKRFDPERGVRLVSFAIHWIKAEIHEYIIKNWRLVKIATTKAQRKLFFNLRSMKAGSAALSAAEAADVAHRLGVKPEDVTEMDSRFAGGDVALDGSREDGEEAAFAPIDYLADTRSEPTAVLAAREDDHLHGPALRAALDNLDDRSRRIIEARWLGEDGGATLHDLAAEFGVSAERIRQIETRAMQKMREALTAAA